MKKIVDTFRKTYLIPCISVFLGLVPTLVTMLSIYSKMGAVVDVLDIGDVMLYLMSFGVCFITSIILSIAYKRLTFVVGQLITTVSVLYISTHI